MNKVEIIRIEEEKLKPVTKLTLGDIYEDAEDGYFYIVGIEVCHSVNRHVLYNLNTGFRATDLEGCLQMVNSGRMIKLQKGTIIQIKVGNA